MPSGLTGSRAPVLVVSCRPAAVASHDDSIAVPSVLRQMLAATTASHVGSVVVPLSLQQRFAAAAASKYFLTATSLSVVPDGIAPTVLSTLCEIVAALTANAYEGLLSPAVSPSFSSTAVNFAASLHH
ncbi:hypothetical protein IWX49DRAFT_595272 [Phyllosticta citricarpa]